MQSLQLKNHAVESETLISNRFLDFYMPSANGEFVKIYLFLLRNARTAADCLSLASIADTFDCTETDVERALRYWQKQRLLRLEYDDTGSIRGIALLDVPDAPTPEPARTTDDVRQAPAPAISQDRNTACFISPDHIRELQQNEEVAQLLFIAEQYLGKTLSSTDISRILYFYEELHFSADLVEYLIEYCVSKGSRSSRYMEKVALSWAEEGITTADEARNATTTRNRNYYTVLKAFGLSGRNPVTSEITMIDRWLTEYRFDMEIIREACSRTVAQTGKASFAYADSILSSWRKSGVQTPADIARLDAERKTQKTQKASKEPGAARTKSPANTNRFHNFHQRDYNYSDLEKQLLNQ